MDTSKQGHHIREAVTDTNLLLAIMQKVSKPIQGLALYSCRLQLGKQSLVPDTIKGPFKVKEYNANILGSVNGFRLLLN